jgi:hypothetical protein
LPSVKLEGRAADLVEVLFASLPPTDDVRGTEFFGRARKNDVTDLDVVHSAAQA